MFSQDRAIVNPGLGLLVIADGLGGEGAKQSAIASNTLNWFAPRIAELNLSAEFVSFQSVLEEWIANTGVPRLALLGAGPVIEMGEWSAYRDLTDLTEVELPSDPKALHRLIEDVKRLGSDDPSLRPRFKQIVDSLASDVLILACTELPLIADIDTEKTLVDVTDLVADALVVHSIPTTQRLGCNGGLAK